MSWAASFDRPALARTLRLVGRAGTTALVDMYDSIELRHDGTTLYAACVGTAGSIVGRLEAEAPPLEPLLVPREVAGIVESIGTEQVELRVEPGGLEVAGGRTNIRLPRRDYDTVKLPVLEPPSFDRPGAGWMRVARAQQVIDKLLPFVAPIEQKDRIAYQGVVLDGQGWTATDGYRLAELEDIGLVDGGVNGIIPRKALADLGAVIGNMDKTEEVLVALDDRRVCFVADNIEIVTPQLNGEQMEYRSKIRAADVWVTLDQKVLLAALWRIEMSVPDLSALAFRTNACYVIGQNKAGPSIEVLPCLYEGPQATQRFRLDYLISMVRAAGLVVRFGPPTVHNEPLAVRGEGDRWKASVYPRRITDDEVRHIDEWIAERSHASTAV